MEGRPVKRGWVPAGVVVYGLKDACFLWSSYCQQILISSFFIYFLSLFFSFLSSFLSFFLSFLLLLLLLLLLRRTVCYHDQLLKWEEWETEPIYIAWSSHHVLIDVVAAAAALRTLDVESSVSRNICRPCSVMERAPVVTRPLQDVRCCDGDSICLEAQVDAPKNATIRWEKQGKVGDVLPELSVYLAVPERKAGFGVCHRQGAFLPPLWTPRLKFLLHTCNMKRRYMSKNHWHI